LRDAFLGTNIPFIEVHISNIYSREDFRKKSFLSDISTGLITGLGTAGYEFALSSIIRRG
jgi:3-dehydroquinate dehydratase-2